VLGTCRENNMKKIGFGRRREEERKTEIMNERKKNMKT
jgi:hypothetical protein